MPKLRVVVLSGGPSCEHEVSLKSGLMVYRHLDRSKYEVEAIIIGKDGHWPVAPRDIKADVVFIAMHGEYGEDGQVQSILENAGLVYTGSDVLASAFGMSKDASLNLFNNSGLKVPEWQVVAKNKLVMIFPENYCYPVVTKPANRGSSIGVSIIHDPAKLLDGLREALNHSSEAMIQRYIKGREVTCGVLDDGLDHAEALIPSEIIPVGKDFFDFEAKYIPGVSKEPTPPDMPVETIRLIQETAVGAHYILRCSGMSRTDMILSDEGELYVLEINTIPGLTENSLLPRQARASGISFPELLDRIVQAALNKKKRTRV